MTIEITLEDLIHLTETAKTNGHSVLYVTRDTTGKRVSLVVTAQQRKHRARAEPKITQASPQASRAD